MVTPNQNQDRDQNQPIEARKTGQNPPGNLKKDPEKQSEISRKTGEVSHGSRQAS